MGIVSSPQKVKPITKKDYDILLKIMLIGDPGVGKTSLLYRYVDNEFREYYYGSIGVDFRLKTLQIEGLNVKLQIWDSIGAGERFRTTSSSYYRGADGIIVVYDITQPDTFTNVENWMQESDKYTPEKVRKLLVGNKCEEETNRKVSQQDALEFAKERNTPFIEVSAKTNANVQALFYQLASSIILYHIELLHIHHTINSYTIPFCGNGSIGSIDTKKEQSTFNSPFGICFNQQNELILCDFNNSTLRKVTQGTVCTLNPTQGWKWDGSPHQAAFNNPTSLCLDKRGDLLIADWGNHRIRKMSGGKVWTLCGSTQGKSDGVGHDAQFHHPFGICLDYEGFFLCTDSNNNRICRISPAGVVTTLAGSTPGLQDGPFRMAKFLNPQGICMDKEGNVIVADWGNHCIRKLDMKEHLVSTLAGRGIPGFRSGLASRALFNNPSGVCLNQEGELYVTDWSNGALRRISNGYVHTIGEKMFKKPRGVCFDEGGLCYVSDEEAQKVLRLRLDDGFCGWELRWRKRIEELLLCLREYGLPREIRVIIVTWLLLREGIKKEIREMLYYYQY